MQWYARLEKCLYARYLLYGLPMSESLFLFVSPIIESYRSKWESASWNNQPRPTPYRQEKLKAMESCFVIPAEIVDEPCQSQPPGLISLPKSHPLLESPLPVKMLLNAQAPILGIPISFCWINPTNMS